jgi:hypothetical protein
MVPRNISDATILKALDEAGFSGAEIREIHANLEDVFVKLTEDAARAQHEEA